jgi:hypothetical protein
MHLTWPSEQHRNDFNDATISAIGRAVYFEYVYSSYGCPVCNLDPATNTGTDSFCPTCSGEYWIEVISGISISGHVLWKTADNLNWFTGGKQWDGNCQVRINLQPDTLDLIKKTKTIVVDSKDMMIDKIDLRGSPIVNRVIIMLKERET